MVSDEIANKMGRLRVFALILHHSSFITAFVLGAAAVAGFAPFYFFPLPILTLAALFALWQAADARRAALAGYAYGLGFFLFGVSWVYVSMNDFGGMPAPLAALVTLLFCMFLALFPAAVGYFTRALPAPRPVQLALLAPALWTLAEWLRGWVLTGFPWLAAGYSQTPASPLAGYAPVLGVYGVTLSAAVTAGLLVVLWLRLTNHDERGTTSAKRKLRFTWRSAAHYSSFLMVAIWLGGWGLKQVEWTEPAGAPVTVSLLQGNVAQDLKWRPDRLRSTLDAYRRLAESSTGRLIVFPETALPLFLDQLPPDYLSALAGRARRNGGDILIGVPERLASGEYFNSVLSYGSAPTQTYRKSHLVPFGEFIPLRPWLAGIVGRLAIPLQDFARGADDQKPLAVAGQRVAVNISYEVVFGEEIIRQLPEATLLVNVSNVAWFGRSIAPQQQLQISQTRALETGRTMLRATNTGVTAAIDPHGEVIASVPEFVAATLTLTVQGYSGATPYVRWGNYAVLALILALLAAAYRARSRTARSA